VVPSPLGAGSLGAGCGGKPETVLHVLPYIWHKFIFGSVVVVAF